MTKLVADLLEFSRVSSKGKPFVPVDLNEVIQGVISDLEARFVQTGGRAEVLHLPTVASDPIQMRQLLQKVLGNALKFHRRGETPVVRVSAEIFEEVARRGHGLQGLLPDGRGHGEQPTR